MLLHAGRGSAESFRGRPMPYSGIPTGASGRIVDIPSIINYRSAHQVFSRSRLSCLNSFHSVTITIASDPSAAS